MQEIQETKKQKWRAGSVIAVILAIAVLILLVCAVVMQATGYRAHALLSGTMEPSYKKGSLLLIKETDPEALEEGDVILYSRLTTEPATSGGRATVETLVSRISAIETAGDRPLRFVTRDVASQTRNTATVPANAVLGTAIFSIPWLGYAMDTITHAPGSYIAVAVIALIILWGRFAGAVYRRKEGKPIPAEQRIQEIREKYPFLMLPNQGKIETEEDVSEAESIQIDGETEP